ncbi:CRE-MTM-6 protein [Caenorhabditis remanei]|uniref:phosphatidylinositol-3,5-bisphosphate 3-phosphatase n=1 Tax=Caenorhabditis remanei TaxID=31234 RepID=E3MFP8_CAERE|nr:CRE-MTM-6 protein [Caenorhabditis remanei]
MSSSTPSSVTTPLTTWWNNMTLSGIYPSISTSTPSTSTSSSWSSHFIFGGYGSNGGSAPSTANTPQSTVAPSALSSGYTEDITVAGSLLKDKINGLMDSLMGRESVHAGCGYGEDGRIAMMVDKVYLVDRLGTHENLVGTVHVTTTHIIFRAENGTKELWLATGLIASVERGTLTAAGCMLVIRCKHFQVITLLISRDKSCQDLYETLQRAAKPVSVNVTELLAFENREPVDDARGWKRLDWANEMARQGVSQSKWIQSPINEGYTICDTYPDKLWFPTAASTSVLLGSCKFRSRGRLPVLTYYHRQTEAALCRCAQPLTGFSARCVEDEKLMELVGKANPNSENLFLVDTRPRVNAMVNKVQGKGFEDERNYSNMRFHFFDIENIHVMRASQSRLLDAVTKCRDVAEYWKTLESSGWLKHVRSVVECSLFLAESISRGTSCVVHCSDGWDRTSQVVAMCQLLLDPYYRTIHGFQVLIEKDWLGFGHKFDDRCGHVGALNDEAGKEVSPIFTQWLDCIWQIMQQKPRAFQFNERYLIEMHEHVYSCQFGTFIGNCDKDRRDLNLAKRTKSLWTWMDARHDDYMNPFYSPTAHVALLDLDTRAARFTVWTAMYNRFDAGLQPRERLEDITMASMEHVGVLESHVAQLRTRLAELKGQQQQMTAATTPTNMVDSGMSSATDELKNLSLTSHPLDPLSPVSPPHPLERATSQESGVMDSSLYYPDEALTKYSLKWQPLRGADRCSNPACRGEFSSTIERRIHCHLCGMIFCRRCLKVTADERERVCDKCKAD